MIMRNLYFSVHNASINGVNRSTILFILIDGLQLIAAYFE